MNIVTLLLINSYVYDRIYAVLHEHTKEDIRMKQRNIVVCILLSLVTCGNLRHLLDDRTERRNQRALRQAGYKRRTGFPVLTDYMRDLCPVLDVPDGQCR